MAKENMTPADSMPMPEDAGMAPSESMTPAAPTQDGSVMVSMPKVAFDAIRELIVQLASGLDSLAQGVDQQAAAEAEAAVGGEMMPPEGAMTSEDEDFLAGITQEGSQR
jgi:hypothetical protein